VRPASQLDVLDRRLATDTVGLHVVKLEEATLRAATAVGSDKGALTAVTLPHLALGLGRNVTRARIGPAAGSWSIGRSKLLFLELSDQYSQGFGHHFAHVSIGDLMAQQVLGPAQQIMRLLAGRELDHEARRRQGDHHRLRGKTDFQRGEWRFQRCLVAGKVNLSPRGAKGHRSKMILEKAPSLLEHVLQNRTAIAQGWSGNPLMTNLGQAGGSSSTRRAAS
jgi:hypothetical protein